MWVGTTKTRGSPSVELPIECPDSRTRRGFVPRIRFYRHVAYISHPSVLRLSRETGFQREQPKLTSMVMPRRGVDDTLCLTFFFFFFCCWCCSLLLLLLLSATIGPTREDVQYGMVGLLISRLPPYETRTTKQNESSILCAASCAPDFTGSLLLHVQQTCYSRK